MTQYKRIGIDTSKAVFTLHGIDQQDRPVLRRAGGRRTVRRVRAGRGRVEVVYTLSVANCNRE